MKWVLHNQGVPARWAHKKDIPDNLLKSAGNRAVQCAFRFETVWIVRDLNGCVMTRDGRWAETLDCRLATPGHVIGLRDLAAADDSGWSDEWRAAMHDHIKDRLAFSTPATHEK